MPDEEVRFLVIRDPEEPGRDGKWHERGRTVRPHSYLNDGALEPGETRYEATHPPEYETREDGARARVFRPTKRALCLMTGDQHRPVVGCPCVRCIEAMGGQD